MVAERRGHPGDAVLRVPPAQKGAEAVQRGRGGVHVADGRHGHVRSVDEEGIIHNVAGAASQWDKGDGGPAICANLIEPISVVHDADDAVYIGDRGAGRIRRIDPETGVIDTVAGGGSPGYSGDGGSARKAEIGSPTSMAFDREGNLYFSDELAHVIRRIDLCGTITTVVGIGKLGFAHDGTAAQEAQLNSPQGVTIASDGALIFSDTKNHRVRRVGLDGTLQTVAGTDEAGYFGDNDTAIRAGLNSPRGLCFYGEDLLLIADHFNHRIRAVKLTNF